MGHLITKSSIQADSTKVKTMLEMPNPANLKELKGLRGRLAYIKQFITNLSGKRLRFAKLMKKGVTFEWNKKCEEAFLGLKEYLAKPPILMAPIPRKKFILYARALDHSMGALVAQKNEQNHEMALYYLSRMIIRAEHNYSPVDKECLAKRARVPR